MIKKVDGSKKAKKTSSVESSSEVSSVKKASGVSKTEKSQFRAPTREITPELKEQLFQILEDEADKLLSDEGISNKRKSRVKNALKMAIEAGNVEEAKNDKETE